MRIPSCIVLCFLASLASAADRAVYTEIDSFSLSKAMPVHETIHDWKGDLRDASFAETYNRFELGFRWNNWRIGYVARYDYRLNFSPDAARFYYEEKNDITLDADRSYDIDIEVYHQSSQGIAFHYDWQPLQQLALTGSLTLLQAHALTEGRLAGRTQFLEGNRYGGHLQLDYQYTDDLIFKRPLNDDFTGNGYSLDLAVDFRPTAHTRFYARTHDLLARLYWNRAPRTVATAAVSPRATEDPFEFYKRAAVSGTESFKDLVQHLPQRFDLGGSYRQDQWRLSLDTFVYPDQLYLFPRIGRMYEEWELSVMGEPRLRALGLRIDQPAFFAELMSDDINFKQARFLRLGVGMQIAF